jgi:hypothetical protein
MGLERSQWARGARLGPLGAGTTDAVLTHFTIQPLNIFTTFRALVFTPAAVPVAFGALELRFGFEDNDADISSTVIAFDPSALINQDESQTVSAGYEAVPTTPNQIQGNPNSILPPRVAVYAQGVDLTDAVLDIFYSCLYLP